MNGRGEPPDGAYPGRTSGTPVARRSGISPRLRADRAYPGRRAIGGCHRARGQTGTCRVEQDARCVCGDGHACHVASLLRGHGREQGIAHPRAPAAPVDEIAQHLRQPWRRDLAVPVENGPVVHRSMLEPEDRDLLATGRQRKRRHGSFHQRHIGGGPRDQRNALLGQFAPPETDVQHAQAGERLAHRSDAAAACGDAARTHLRGAAHEQRSGVGEPSQAVDAGHAVHEFRGVLAVEPSIDLAFHQGRQLQ